MKLIKQLQDIFREVFDDPELQINHATNRSNFVSWDSVAHVQLILLAESEFGVRLSFDEVSNIKDVGTFVEVLSKRTGVS